MTFLTNKQIELYLARVEDIKLGIKPSEIPFPIEKAQKIIDEFARMPLVNMASKNDILKAVEKCENTNK